MFSSCSPCLLPSMFPITLHFVVPYAPCCVLLWISTQQKKFELLVFHQLPRNTRDRGHNAHLGASNMLSSSFSLSAFLFFGVLFFSFPYLQRPKPDNTIPSFIVAQSLRAVCTTLLTSQRETKRHLVTGSLMHLAAKKSFTQLFKYLYPQSPRFLIFSKKTWKISRIAGRGGGGGGGEQGLHVCNYRVLKCDVVSFRVDDTKHFVVWVYTWNTSIGAHSFLHLVMDSY